MVMTITPMVHGGQRRKWVFSVFWHMIGGALGGALALAVLAATVQLLALSNSTKVVIAAAVFSLALVFDLGLIRARIPSPKRQVPRRWREGFAPHTTAFLYGLGLGTGLTTRVYFAITYAVFIGAPLLLSLPLAMAVGAAFGLARGASVWVAHSAQSHDSLEAIALRREGRRELAGRLNAVGIGSALAVLLFTNF